MSVRTQSRIPTSVREPTIDIAQLCEGNLVVDITMEKPGCSAAQTERMFSIVRQNIRRAICIRVDARLLRPPTASPALLFQIRQNYSCPISLLCDVITHVCAFVCAEQEPRALVVVAPNVPTSRQHKTPRGVGMPRVIMCALASAALAATAGAVACKDDNTTIVGPDASLVCDSGNGGITLPAGFCAIVVADLTIGGQPAKARHLIVLPNGDVFVAINPTGTTQPANGIIGLRDTNKDGKADQQTAFSANLGGSGIAWSNGSLYLGANDRVMRYSLPQGQLTPTGDAVTVASGLPSTGDHGAKTVVVTGSDLYVNFGSATNSCQVANRVNQSPGIYPCPELPLRAGIWKFNAAGENQTATTATRFATGYRNMVALAINPNDGKLYGVQHGRDTLFGNWSQFYTAEQSAELPAEEFVRIDASTNNGWPYCYYDALTLNQKVLAPEYGGDGKKVTGTQGIDCASYNQPLATFLAHYAPNGVTFYTGNMFPAKYRNGIFVAMHGSHNRSPLVNDGFNVTFQPLNSDGTKSGADETFADGFDGGGAPLPANAVHRPVGVAVGPDGSLYVSDDKGGRIWRIIYRR